MKVIFPELHTEIAVDPGTRLSDACEWAGAPLDLVCGGNGTCDKCRVDIVEGKNRRSVLGCQHRITQDIKVFVEKKRAHQLLETAGEQVFELDPGIEAVAISRESLRVPMGGYDFDVLAREIQHAKNISVETPSQEVLLSLSCALHASVEPIITVIVAGNEIIDVVSGDCVDNVFGIAVDIGTTSVVAFLYRMKTGTLLGHTSALNRQHRYGADVISRIEHTQRLESGLALEQAAIVETVDELVCSLCSETGVDPQEIYAITYCGNSTMQHLFMGFPPAPLGRSPFIGLVSQPVTVPARQVPIRINKRGVHVFMPLLGGFVGADTTACLIELPDDGKPRMMIDLGTNCEVAIGTHGHMLVASTACGPALEGAGLSMGMRATEGAIERVSYNEESDSFAIGVIGDVAPIGFCGSGIVDMIAVLLKTGLINGKGAFVKGNQRESHPLGSRIRERDGVRRFVLVDAGEHPEGREISITLKDIRAIQLAKSAIYTGYTLLTKTYGIKPEELAEIRLAGAFGNYIDISCAKSIGLLPDVEGVPIRSMGNGAGLGVQRYLLSAEARKRADRLRRNTTHIELASDKAFTETYMRGMSFEDNSCR